MYEKYRWNTVTTYVDIDTGEEIPKEKIGVYYKKIEKLDTKTTRNDRTYTITKKLIYSCEKLAMIQGRLLF